MAKRDYTLSVVCAEDGCKETRFYNYTSRKEYDEAVIDPHVYLEQWEAYKLWKEFKKTNP